MDITIHDGTLCDSHGWHSGNWCYHCKFDALEMRHDQTVDELDLTRKQVDEYKTKESMALEQAKRFSDEANEMRSILDENSKLHLSTIRLIARMENELKDAIEALDLAQAYIRRKNIYDVTIILQIIDEAMSKHSLKMEKI